MAAIHDRMPAVIEPEGAGAWLEGADASLLRPAAAGILAAHRVSTKVNLPEAAGEDLIARVDEPPNPPTLWASQG